MAKLNDNVIYLSVLRELAEEAYETAYEKGFWHDYEHLLYDIQPTISADGVNTARDMHMAQLIALIHSEASEALETIRRGNSESQKIPEFSQLEEELADIIIRVLDFSAGHELDVPGALLAKMRYNKSRPDKHGKAF